MALIKRLHWIILCLIIGACNNSQPAFVDWPAYLGDKSSSQYTGLKTINKSNVHQLEVAWTYASGDADTINNRSQIQCNPLIVDGILYGSSALLKFFALDAATGEELWVFDPFAAREFEHLGMGVNRGLAYWTDGVEQRLLVTASSYLYCIDAATGQIFKDFGQNGKVDLHDGLDREVPHLFMVSNTPGVVYEDKLILGGRVSEGGGAAPGHIRAYNVKTGAQEWIFHTIPFPGEYGYETWPEGAWKYVGGANAWAGFSLDEKRGMVFVPTGSAATDFYGGDRQGENLFANCLIALDASTGERIWHYQMVHHDLWDRDLPAPPNLVTVEHNGEQIDAVAQITKSAHIFLLNRETGEPLFPVEEVPVPPSKLGGEQAWPTQPIPTKPPAFSRNRITESELTRRTPEAYAYVKAKWDSLQEGPYFIPPSLKGAIIFPGLDGGGEWGGAAFDPASGNLIVNASEMPWVLKMNPAKPATGGEISQGRGLYNTFCLSCHGKDKKGGELFGAVPSLVNLKNKIDAPQVVKTIKKGKGVMPSFAFLTDDQISVLSNYLLEIEHDQEAPSGEVDNRYIYPYYFDGYNKFLDQDGYPPITPPWGTLNAINLNTGEISWKVSLGEYPELVEAGLPPTGSESYGGPVVTAGGLVFMAGTLDEKIRAFDKDSGKLLWQNKLPAAGFATPASYAIGGKQYVVIACGGGKLGRPSGDQYVAFSLPD